MGRRTTAVALLGVLAACSAPSEVDRSESQSTSPPASGSPSVAPPTVRPSTPGPSATPPVRPGAFDAAWAMTRVRHLAVRIGPRHGTSAASRDAATWVAGELDRIGYDVRRQGFGVPGGDSWGVPVRAGRAVNVVARPPGLGPGEPHLVVGAHLDTVPQSPGAEDNASGVAVLLTAARAVARARTRLPVVWVAFGAEEPRGPTDADHHYGSRAYVAALGAAERRAMRGMVSLDRVGVGAVVPVGSTAASDPVQRALLGAARRAGVPTRPDPFQRSSDHWSFVRAGLPAARLGSTPYAGYHSADDVASVVRTAQLDRVGRLLLAWLAPR